MRDGRLWRIATFAVVGISVIALLVGVVWLALTAQTQRDELAASQANAQELYEQLIDEGVEPDGEAPAQVSPIVPENGRDGDDGARGERGPGPTAEQVLDGIRACFAAGTCTAPKGDKGDTGTSGTNGTNGNQGLPGSDSTTPGPMGPQGVGVASIDCLDDGTWRFAMTDGTTRDVPGPCRFVVTPEPTPEPTPDPSEGEPSP